MALFTAGVWILMLFIVPETYGPVLLRKRANKLSEMTGKIYKTEIEAKDGRINLAQAFKTALSRPWILLFREPIGMFLYIIHHL